MSVILHHLTLLTVIIYHHIYSIPQSQLELLVIIHLDNYCNILTSSTFCYPHYLVYYSHYLLCCYLLMRSTSNTINCDLLPIFPGNLFVIYFQHYFLCFQVISSNTLYCLQSFAPLGPTDLTTFALFFSTCIFCFSTQFVSWLIIIITLAFTLKSFFHCPLVKPQPWLNLSAYLCLYWHS